MVFTRDISHVITDFSLKWFMSVILEEIKNQADQNTLVKSSFMLDYIKSKIFLGFYS